ncbi:NADP-dependent oxidoreductase [Streptomyces sp. NPDC059455]|uniref:NADP-dependent oxidoreductase n=1 Tax=Streptomyces sp. NPDC059455 TaxID=3346837 RepID=UPI00369D1799
MQASSVTTAATASRAVLFDSFGGPEALNVRDVPALQAGPGQIRVRVTAAGLNPMDWFMTSDAETAARFGLSLPCGFGTDYAGVVDQIGDGVSGFTAGERVFGGAMSRSVADHVVIDVAGTIAAGGAAHRTPDGVDDRTAAALTIAGSTAAAALAVVSPGPGDTVLIGGAGGGVGVFAVQLAKLTGARVIGTGSASSADALRALGAEPVAYGDGLAERVRALAPGVTAAIDLHGTETARVARELGVPDDRITTIAAQIDGITPANGANAAPGAIEEIARLVAEARLRVPIAATFPIEQIRAAAELQAGRHVHGKVVINLGPGEPAAEPRD